MKKRVATVMVPLALAITVATSTATASAAPSVSVPASLPTCIAVGPIGYCI